MSISITNYKEFTEKFLTRYLEHGFGTLTKREIDILIMHLILEYGDLEEASNHDLSIKLKISESKVKNLRYEAKLKNIKDQEQYVKEEFLKLLRKVKFETEKKKIILPIEDNYLKSAIQAKLKKLGSFADSSFNSELVKISEDAFVELLSSFYLDEERKDFEDRVKELIRNEDALTFNKLMKAFLEGAAKKAGGKVVDLGINYLSGGFSGILEHAVNLFSAPDFDISEYID